MGGKGKGGGRGPGGKSGKVMYQDIARSASPAEAKKLGRQVAGFDEDVWARIECSIAFHVVHQKFAKTAWLREILLGQSGLYAEMTKNDANWGTGVDWDDPRAKDPSQWPGTNMLGWALSEVRDELLAERGLAQFEALLTAQEEEILGLGRAEDAGAAPPDAEGPRRWRRGRAAAEASSAAAAPEAPVVSEAGAAEAPVSVGGDAETERKIKALRKKLWDIAKLKERPAEQLDATQRRKVEGEANLLEQLVALGGEAELSPEAPEALEAPQVPEAPVASATPEPRAPDASEGAGSDEAERKIKALRKKLRDIAKLKERPAEQLDADQRKKVEGETDFLEQVVALGGDPDQ